MINDICCIGAGYVGGPTMSVIALKCPKIKVTVVDADTEKINRWNGPLEDLPVYEPGLKEVIKKTRDKNLFFSNKIKDSIKKADMIFMAVNTPTKTEGDGAGMAADLKYIESCARDIAKYANSDKIIVEKSTVPIKTAEKIKKILVSQNSNYKFEILSNPEFLAEGTAIEDMSNPDRVLIGGDPTPSGKKAVVSLFKIYSQWVPANKILTTNVWSSELSKLASNAMLAQRISSINSLSALCEKTGADIGELSKAIGMDSRIGSKFLKASVGFGGSCFQKDILNLVYLCKFYGLHEVADYWHNVVKINDYQKSRFTQKIIDYFLSTKKTKNVTVLGWAFKANTNDSRESPSISITNALLVKEFNIKIYDPQVPKAKIMNDLGITYNTNIKICETLEESVKDSNALLVITEWNEFKDYDWDMISKDVMIFDGRRIIKNREKLFKIGSS